VIPQSHSAGRFRTPFWAEMTREDTERYIEESAQLLDPDLVRYIRRYHALQDLAQANLERMTFPWIVLPAEWPPRWVGWL
jgi:hypothetical protein